MLCSIKFPYHFGSESSRSQYSILFISVFDLNKDSIYTPLWASCIFQIIHPNKTPENL
uniref:Uncharacterized protein n=1 Tax=Octopus bimaculoides TaxID=37653 RepID=A0A0L8FL46_OCTBM